MQRSDWKVWMNGREGALITITYHGATMMNKAIRACAIIEHDSQCSVAQRPRLKCCEPHFGQQKTKKAFFRGDNNTITRDLGVAVSAVWAGLINNLGCGSF
ncbi:hypothetical protein M514_12803 [Trichuris suis]|uniref:Uncharacterized protein n=1 Tax=Trichuris suis TaxID=68888 RepID=A0A085N3F9_9BILA|nr:hypothetical protein M514_12803 [Trichuris suis]